MKKPTSQDAGLGLSIAEESSNPAGAFWPNEQAVLKTDFQAARLS